MKKKNEPKIWIVTTVLIALMVTSAFALLASGIIDVSASGPTYVSGILSSDTTWTAADSPYIVTGNILVEDGVTLTIEPGVVVKFNSAKAIQIDGELIAQGTEAEPIVFTSNQSSSAPGDWVNILFTDSSVDATFDEDGNYVSGSIMQYCTVEYGGGSDTPAIKIVSSSPLIGHCTVSNNANGGIYVDQGSPRITSNTISNNSGSGIYTCDATVIISNNIVTNNGGGIYVDLGTVTISGNTIFNNSANCGGGIYLNSPTATIDSNIVTSNSADSSGGGIGTSQYPSTVTISNNTISNNSAASCGGGIRIYCSGVTINNNAITYNSALNGGGIFANPLSGVTISGNTISNNLALNGGGIFWAAHVGIISYNTIMDNSISEGDGKAGGIYISWQPIINSNNIYNNTPYDVYNANSCGSPDVNATNNWWETTDEAAIQAHIYDWFDDASLGIVDYSPYLTEPVTPENIPPIASFAYYPESPVVAQTITFNASNSTDPDGNITSYEWDFGDGNNTNTTAPITTYSYASAGTYNVNLTVTDDDGATNSTSKLITVSELERFIFDTGAPANPYPSIMGNHTGTIKPNHTVIATKVYTYPCTGTGGHTEYASIGNKTWNATATWEGYIGDWHNITFDKNVVLLVNETYDYTIRTGSYPQIIHKSEHTSLDGSFINCTKFTDANGRIYTDWIPAIRLE